MIWVLFPDLILRLTCLNSPRDAKLQSDVPGILESTPSAELSGRQMGKAWKGFPSLCRLFFAFLSLGGLPWFTGSGLTPNGYQPNHLVNKQTFCRIKHFLLANRLVMSIQDEARTAVLNSCIKQVLWIWGSYYIHYGHMLIWMLMDKIFGAFPCLIVYNISFYTSLCLFTHILWTGMLNLTTCHRVAKYTQQVRSSRCSTARTVQATTAVVLGKLPS